MIIGIGTDIVSIERIRGSFEQYGQKFINRCFTKNEQIKALEQPTKDIQLAYLSKRWAAKEACAKAFGTGIGHIIGFHDIDVSKHNKEGKPLIIVTGKAKKHLMKKHLNKELQIDISLSDEKDLALAFVVISV